jgi:hypothetical protein
MIATSSGVSTRPAACRPSETATATANESAKPTAVSRRTGPRRRAKSISSPARKSTNASPISAMTEIAASSCTTPSTDGPATMPATISSTTDGRRTLGARPSRNGAAKATTATMSRLLSDGISRPRFGGQRAATATRNTAVNASPGATWRRPWPLRSAFAGAVIGSKQMNGAPGGENTCAAG